MNEETTADGDATEKRSEEPSLEERRATRTEGNIKRATQSVVLYYLKAAGAFVVVVALLGIGEYQNVVTLINRIPVVEFPVRQRGINELLHSQISLAALGFVAALVSLLGAVFYRYRMTTAHPSSTLERRLWVALVGVLIGAVTLPMELLVFDVAAWKFVVLILSATYLAGVQVDAWPGVLEYVRS